MWPCRGLLLRLREPPWGEGCDQGSALCHCSLVHPGPAAQRAGKLPPGSTQAFWVGLCLPPWLCPQERVQADDLVKMLFGMEEGDLEPELEKESPAAIVVEKDEL